MWTEKLKTNLTRYSIHMVRTLAFLSALFFTAVPIGAYAATLSIVPEKTTIEIGQEVTARIAINTEETAINAAQATITFPAETLEVLHIDVLSSAFNFWVEEPAADNTAGTIKFIGGTAKGITGDNLTVATVTFKSLGSGSASLSLENAAITASDGKGTNVLSAVNGATLTVGAATYVPQPEFDPSKVVVESVQQVTRKAVAASGYPEAPQVSVPLYPDPTTWYKHHEPVTVFWNIPDDVIKVALAVDDKPNTEPSKSEEGLFTGKALGEFKEGEHYIHVQFKNNVGWGPVTHYRIGIDTAPPTPFTVEFDGPIGDDPTPTFHADSFDALSGVDKVLVSIDGAQPFEFASTTITLPPQKPGSHDMVVRVLDKARNSAENTATFTVDPLPTPSISFITNHLSQNEQGFISGNAIPGGFVDVQVLNKDGAGVLSGTAATDASGNWRFTFDKILPIGTYSVVVSARDQREAVSYPTDPITMKVRPQTVLSLGFVDLGWFEIFLLVVLIATSVGGFAAWYYVKEQNTQSAYAAIAARDVKKFGDLITAQLKNIESSLEEQNKGRTSKGVQRLQGEIGYSIAQIKDTIIKMNRYLVDLINKA